MNSEYTPYNSKTFFLFTYPINLQIYTNTHQHSFAINYLVVCRISYLAIFWCISKLGIFFIYVNGLPVHLKSNCIKILNPDFKHLIICFDSILLDTRCVPNPSNIYSIRINNTNFI